MRVLTTFAFGAVIAACTSFGSSGDTPTSPPTDGGVTQSQPDGAPVVSNVDGGAENASDAGAGEAGSNCTDSHLRIASDLQHRHLDVDAAAERTRTGESVPHGRSAVRCEHTSNADVARFTS